MNALTPTIVRDDVQTVRPANNYVSIFDDVNVFESTLRMAEVLSSSLFVPEAFRNKPNDCIIAIDLAKRLGIAPTTLLPHLYVIDSRPSFSTQFLISLVDRSGRFSRIQYDEGIAGETEVTYSGWGERKGERKSWKQVVPNYYAKACFTELSSGELFESPIVDIAFAERNGWVSKNGSKWRTMPEIMCAYRAASILVKRVCPELLLGLEFVEDVEDSREETAPRRVETRVRTNVVPTIQTTAGFRLRLDRASSVVDLASIAQEIATSDLDEASKRELRNVYRARQSSLTATRPAVIAAPVAVEPAPEEPEQSETMTEDELRAAIESATNAEALESLMSALEIGAASGSLRDYAGLKDALDARLAEFAPKEPTKRQESVAAMLMKCADDAKSRDDLQTLSSTAAEARKKGDITADQFLEVGQYIDESAQRFLV